MQFQLGWKCFWAPYFKKLNGKREVYTSYSLHKTYWDSRGKPRTARVQKMCSCESSCSLFIPAVGRNEWFQRNIHFSLLYEVSETVHLHLLLKFWPLGAMYNQCFQDTCSETISRTINQFHFQQPRLTDFKYAIEIRTWLWWHRNIVKCC